MNQSIIEFETGENDCRRRLDRILRKALPDHPLSLIHRLLRQGKVLLDGKSAGAQERVNSGSRISISIEEAVLHRKETALPSPAPLEIHDKLKFFNQLEILSEGGGLLILNKPAGLEVHGPDSLETRVRAYLADSIPPSLSFRPGPLHRLDKPTSGIIVFSTSLEGARFFSGLLRRREVKKYYLVFVEGRVETEEIWRDALIRDHYAKKTFVADAVEDQNGEAKSALTKVSPLASVSDSSGGVYTLLLAEIKTGRTHQIRAQATAHGHPLAGDRKYGAQSFGGFFLHAWKLNLDGITITAPPPAAFLKRIKAIFGETFSRSYYIKR